MIALFDEFPNLNIEGISDDACDQLSFLLDVIKGIDIKLSADGSRHYIKGKGIDIMFDTFAVKKTKRLVYGRYNGEEVWFKYITYNGATALSYAGEVVAVVPKIFNLR